MATIQELNLEATIEKANRAREAAVKAASEINAEKAKPQTEQKA